MRKILIIAIFCGFMSCDMFESKDKKTQELIEQEMRSIDWNTVDNYPLFESCDETLSKSGQQECFQQQLLTHFVNTISEFEFILEDDVNSVVYVDFTIDQNGKIAVLDIEKDAAIDKQMPEFDGIITQSLKGLPAIAPALKRGIPVKTRFRIPIQLNSE